MIAKVRKSKSKSAKREQKIQKIKQRLQRIVQNKNNEIKTNALVAGSMGFLFSLMTFCFTYALAWMVTLVGLGLGAFQSWVPLFVTVIFVIVAFVSAWYRVNPYEGLRKLTDAEYVMTLVSQVSSSFAYASPRHVTSGFAGLILAGPSGLCEALRLWNDRLKVNEKLLTSASTLLSRCEKPYDCDKVTSPYSPLLLRKLSLIKVVLTGRNPSYVVTDKGDRLLG